MPDPTGCDKSTRRVKFRFRRRANHLYDSCHPVPEEGALAIVTERWDGMRWTLRRRARGVFAGRVSVSGARRAGRTMPKRTAKSCGPDASVVGVKSAEGKSARPGADKPAIRRRRRREEPDTPG